jgi:hypothetical protein
MRKLLVALFTVFLAFSTVAPAFAQDGRLYTSGLTKEQELQLEMQIEKLKQTNSQATPNIPLITPESLDNVQKYTEVGLAIGKGLAGAAKEVGVAVNEFAQTDVGKMTMFLIVWNFFGEDLKGIVLALILFVTLVPIWFYAYRRFVVIKKITKTPVPNSLRSKTEVEYQEKNGDKVFGMFCLLAFIIVAVTIIAA